MDWFRHDIYAHDDIKLRKVQRKFGFYGTGVYWYLVEKIYQNDGCMSRDEMYDELGMYCIGEDKARDLVDTFIGLGLFTESDGVISCSRIKEEIEFNAEARQKKVEAGKKGMLSRWGNRKASADNTDNTINNTDNTVINTQSADNTNLTIPTIPKDNIEVSNDTSLSSPAENDGVNLPSVPRETVDYQGVVAMFNAICTSFPRVTKLSDGRKKAIRARVHYGYTMDDFKKVFESAQSSSFLKGNNKRNWSATFDWMINGENMAKILDGNFNDKTPSDESQVRTNEVPVRKKDLSDITDEELEESKKVSWV